MTTPNLRAFKGFMTMPEWVCLCSLDCMFLPLGAGERLLGQRLTVSMARATLATASLMWKRRPGRADSSPEATYTVQAPWSPDSDADELWGHAAQHADIMVPRDRAFLQWRFGFPYCLFVARDARGLVGYAAARVVARGGLKIGMVLDCISIDGGVGAVPLLSSVTDWLKEQGASAAIGYFQRYSASWQQVRTAGFVRLPGRLTPREYPVCVSVRPDEPHSVELLNPSRWHMSLADSDLA
jgi:hypothetical protein